jgi:hypothetical protein
VPTYGLTANVGHGDGRTHFIVYGVELGEYDPIYGVRIVLWNVQEISYLIRVYHNGTVVT